MYSAQPSGESNNRAYAAPTADQNSLFPRASLGDLIVVATTEVCQCSCWAGTSAQGDEVVCVDYLSALFRG
jgi:hypothetical protein